MRSQLTEDVISELEQTSPGLGKFVSDFIEQACDEIEEQVAEQVEVCRKAIEKTHEVPTTYPELRVLNQLFYSEVLSRFEDKNLANLLTSMKPRVVQ